jgi:hypothetical protein
MPNTSNVRYKVVVKFQDGTTSTYTDVVDFQTGYQEVTIRFSDASSTTLFRVSSVSAEPQK